MSSQAPSLRCPACGSFNSPGSRWCANCGRSFETGQYISQVKPAKKSSRLEKMVYYNTVGRHVSKAIGLLFLLVIIVGAALLLMFF